MRNYSSTLLRSPCEEDALIIRYPTPKRDSGNNSNNNSSRCPKLAASVEVRSTLTAEAIISKHRLPLIKPRATYTARRKSVCQSDVVCFWIRKHVSGRPDDQHARTTSSSI